LNRLGKCPFELGLYKPTKNSWIKTKDGVLFGGDGVKLVAIAAGGIRSVVLDEKGTVILNFRGSGARAHACFLVMVLGRER
jgi:hypothetical protein